MNQEQELEIQEAYIVPTKQIPPPRGTRPLGGVAGNHARKLAAKRMMDKSGIGNMEDAIRVAAISQKAEIDGKRRQIDVKELARIVQEMEKVSET